MGFSQDRFGQVWPAHVDGLIDFLTQLRAAFRGDLDAALIMAVVGSAALPRGRMPKGLSFKAFRLMDKRDAYYAPLNTFSIAQITGIPRETARRKLARMEQRGWLSRDEDGFWHVAPAGIEALEPMTQYSLYYLNRIAALVQEGTKPKF